MRKYLFISVLILMGVSSYGLDYNGYRLDLDVNEYAKLNTFERAQYKKAIDLANSKQYRAAASEFEKFKVQFTDSPILPYILFMKGYSLHMQKDRYSAIKVYNEVLDYFGEEIDPASRALFFLGVANFQNGDTKQGLEAMVEMVEDEDYSQHPLAAGALDYLANNSWKNDEKEQAVKYWKQIVKDFSKSNSRVATAARDSIMNYYVIKKNYTGLDSWGIAPDSTNKQKMGFVNRVDYNAWVGFYHNRGVYKFNQFQKKDSNAIKKAFINYYISKKPFYEQDDDMWTYYYQLLNFLSRIYYDKELMDKTINETITLVSKMENKDVADSRYVAVINRLRDDKKYTQAELLISRMNNQVLAEWQRQIILERRYKWEDAIKKLDLIASMNVKDAQRCADRKGYIYMYYLRKYDLAIKFYREVDNPPKNLWKIAECQYRQTKLKEAITTLSEIENSFPDSAADSAWKKVEYYKGADDIKLGIANARRIMKMYPNSSASSKAHQYLEGYGIATGGGVL